MLHTRQSALVAVLVTISLFRFLRVAGMTTSSSSSSTPPQVNLLELAAASLACSVTASRAIRRIALENEKKTRLKADGSFVTDADVAAQCAIFKGLYAVSDQIRIVGEESAEEMARHVASPEGGLEADVLAASRTEVFMRYHQQKVSSVPLTASLPLAEVSPERQLEGDAAVVTATATPELTEAELADLCVDPARVAVIVDPLDGTKSYANGEYDDVSILIGIILDNRPFFGVIGKPFGYTGLSTIGETKCSAVYGGPLLSAVYVAGRAEKLLGRRPNDDPAEDHLPRAVISGSRSKGIVHDFCVHLGKLGVIAPEPMLVSGAGEKSLRLIMGRQNEALWFFPKAGTSLWDVAAPDALLRVLGGKLTDKFGNEMDYSKSRAQAENVNGVVACIDADLHEQVMTLFRQGDWESQSS